MCDMVIRVVVKVVIRVVVRVMVRVVIRVVVDILKNVNGCKCLCTIKNAVHLQHFVHHQHLCAPPQFVCTKLFLHQPDTFCRQIYT